MTYKSKEFGEITDARLEELTGHGLVRLHNELVPLVPGKKTTKKFSDRKTGLRRVKELLNLWADNAKSQPKKSAKAAKVRERLFLEPATDITHHRKGTKRGKVISLMQKEGGATMEELKKISGWDDKNVILTLKLINLHIGYGIEETADGRFKVSGPVKGRKPFDFPCSDEPKPYRPNTKRARTIGLLGRPEGATVEEVMEEIGWNYDQALEGIKLVHSYVGYGLREDDESRIYLC